MVVSAHASEPLAAASRDLQLPTLRTERLQLVAFDDGHLDEFTRIQYDPRVAEWLGGSPDPPHSPAQMREETWRVMAMFLGHWSLRGYGIWALVDNDTGRFVGRAGLWNPEGWPGLEVGWLVDPDLWGNGYASEAGRAAIDFAFSTLAPGGQALAEVISVTVPHNVRSRRVMERVGLCDTGTTTQLRGKTQVLYRISRQQWLTASQLPAAGIQTRPEESSPDA